jgi:DNA-binding MarR family transcriptional regulator
MRALLDLQVARDLARDSGLSEADYDVLSTVSEAAGHSLRLGDLAAHMLWSKSRLSHHVARMERRGLVAREDCPDDGRGALLTLTEAGWQAITNAAPGHVESVRRNFIDLLTDEQLRVLGDLAETVLAHVSTAQAGAGAGRTEPDGRHVAHAADQTGTPAPSGPERGAAAHAIDQTSTPVPSGAERGAADAR